MKTIYFVILLAFLAAACMTGHEETQMMSVITDKTDSLAVLPEENELLAYMNIGRHEDNGAIFRCRSITNKQLSPISEIHLPTHAAMLDGYQTATLPRRKQILAFYSEVRNAIDAVNKNNGGRLGNSECFKTLADELTRISQSKAASKTLVVYSDMFEHSTIFNMYSKNTVFKLTANPNLLTEELTQTGLLPDSLSGITVYFIFSPLSRKTDQVFNALVGGIYKPMLEKRGAKVIIQASNDFTN